ncbi:CBS domain-containing protein [Salipaludibacillus sp. CUR1]|uniref:CBS domain-containing protein n=1 Tax=Salipaludibacillus sp. CUR1 TaxID=2820003 RepID=UPI001E2E30B8|nr:CBS domain-containing protein [Salipaludibacillus sp. CUR1]MCE7794063.1 CBS domain-containing protein [Salipaludibacillus sp. CUR1]
MKLSLHNRQEYTYYLLFYLKNGKYDLFNKDFLRLHPADQVAFIEECSEGLRKTIYSLLSVDDLKECFPSLAFPLQKELFVYLEENDLKNLLNGLSQDDLADCLQQLPDHISHYYLLKLGINEAKEMEKLMGYPAGSAGALMTTEFLTLNENDTADSVLTSIRKTGKLKGTVYYLFVTGENTSSLIGVVSLKEVLTASPEVPLKSLMTTDFLSVTPSTDETHVYQIFQRYGLLALPVLEDSRLVGIITFDDAMRAALSESVTNLPKRKVLKPHRTAGKKSFKMKFFSIFT